MKSSISYQMALHLGSYAIGCFVIVEFALLLYKTVGESFISLSVNNLP